MAPIDEIIGLLQAYKNGAEMEYRYKGDVNRDPVWLSMERPQFFNFADCIYRVKPEPREPREWWFVKDVGEERRYAWTRHDVRQEGVDYLEQVHVRELLDENTSS